MRRVPRRVCRDIDRGSLWLAKHPIVLHPEAVINAVEDITKLDALPTLDHGAVLDAELPMCKLTTPRCPAMVLLEAAPSPPADLITRSARSRARDHGC